MPKFSREAKLERLLPLVLEEMGEETSPLAVRRILKAVLNVQLNDRRANERRLVRNQREFARRVGLHVRASAETAEALHLNSPMRRVKLKWRVEWTVQQAHDWSETQHSAEFTTRLLAKDHIENLLKDTQNLDIVGPTRIHK